MTKHLFRLPVWTSLLCVLAVVACPIVVRGQASSSPLVPESVAKRHGLVRAWWRQVPVDTTRDHIENVTFHGDTLYIQTKRGTISALDAESGALRWTLQVGSPELVTTGVGANDKYAAVANGMKLYVLAHDDGKIALERTLRNVPGAGPALSGARVFTPTTNGSIESYDIAEPKEPAQIYNSTGRAMTQPFSAGDVLAWTTDRGLFYVAQTDPLSPRFRVETFEPIIVGPGYQPPYLYVGSMDGHVMKVHEMTGHVAWKAAVGDPVDARPTALEDKLYVSSRRGGLRCVLAEAKTEEPQPGEPTDAPREGTVLWQAPSAGRLLAGSEKRLYCLDELGRMSILRRADGGYIDSMNLPGQPLAVMNDVTDRIFIATRYGTVQCLHEAGINKPLNHRRDATKKAAPKAIKQKALEPHEKEKPKEKAKDEAFGEGVFEGDAKGGEKPAEKKKEAPAADDGFGG